MRKKANEFRECVEASLRTEIDLSVERRWKQLKEAVKEAANKVVGYRKSRKAKKPWITQEMLNKMEERRRYKNINSDTGRMNYRRLNNEFRRETEKAKELWWENESSELEELNRKGRVNLLYAKVRQLSWKTKLYGRSHTTIKDNNGELLLDTAEVTRRWKE